MTDHEAHDATTEDVPDDLIQQEALGDVRLLTIPGFRWLVLSHAAGNLAFWGYFGALIAEATFRLDGSPRQLAIFGASLSLPFVVGMVVQGLFVDRWSPKWLNFGGYVIIGGAIAVGWYGSTLLWMYLSSFLVGLGAAAIEPARSALTGLLVPDKDLVRANGVLAVAFQASLLGGTLLGGLLLTAYGSPTVFAVSFVLVLVSFPLAIAVPDVRQQGEIPELTVRDLTRGVRTAWRLPELRLLLFVTAVGWMVFNAFFVLEPLYIRYVLGRPDEAVLYLWSAHGFGAILGAVAVARFKSASGKELTLVGAGVVTSGFGLLLYAGPAVYQLSFIGAAFMGAGLAFMFPAALALVQRVVEEEERGRVSAVLLSLQEFMALVGSLLIVIFGLSTDAVQGVLIGVGVAMVLIGLLGLRAVRRLRARTDARSDG
ncbi:MAG: MFS transporter [Actinomycetota bacterium]